MGAQKRLDVARRGFGQRLVNHNLPPETLSTIVAHTQFISGFHVAHSASTTNSVSLLVGLHEALKLRPPRPKPSYGEDGPGVSYDDFAMQTRKSCHALVFDVFGRMLRVVPH